MPLSLFSHLQAAMADTIGGPSHPLGCPEHMDPRASHHSAWFLPGGVGQEFPEGPSVSNPQPKADVVWRINRPGASPLRWVIGGGRQRLYN